VSLRFATEPLPDTATEPVGTNAEPVYPYSVVPGGVATPAALRRAIQDDPVVRRHYANFDISAMHVVRLRQAQLAHVSYRIGDHVYWTKRRRRLNAGETMLTDGEHYARTRCGNQLAVVPGQTSGEEPEPAVFDAPFTPIRVTHVLPALPAIAPAAIREGGLISAQRGVAYLGTLAGLPAGLAALPTASEVGAGAGGETSVTSHDPSTVDGSPASGNPGIPPSTGSSSSSPILPPLVTTGGETPNSPPHTTPGGTPLTPSSQPPDPPGDPQHPPSAPPAGLPPGSTPPTDPPVKAVPEPGTIALLAAAGGWYRSRRAR
jgi:hypothetical protein